MSEHAVSKGCSRPNLSAPLVSAGESIARGGLVVLLASALGNGASYAFGIFAARMLGAEHFGIYALGLTIFNTVTLMMVLGLDMGMLRFIPQDLIEGGRQRVKSTIGTAITITSAAGIVAGVGLGSVSGPVASFYEKPELATVLALFAVGIPFVTMTTVMVSSLQAFQAIRYTVYIKYLWEPAGKFLLAGCLLWAGYQLTGIVIGVVAALICSTVLAFRSVTGLTAMTLCDCFARNGGEIRRLAAYSFPLAVGNVLGILAPRSDVMLLGYWASVRETGVYLAAFQTAAILILVAAAFDFAVAPLISQAVASNDRERLKQGYQSVLRLSLSFTVPLFLLFVMFGEDILNLFGGEFRAGAVVLSILACGQVFNSATTSANTVLLMSGHSRVVMINTIVFGVLLIGAASILIPMWKITGAAMAAAMSSILLNITRVLEVWCFHGIHPFTRGLFKPVLAGGMVAMIVYFVHGQLDANYLVGLGIACGVLYLVILSILGIEEDDKTALSALYRRVVA